MSDVAYDPNGNFNAGYGRTSQILGDLARGRAGRSLAQGDVRGAANTLYRSGDIAGGQQLQQQASAQQVADQERQIQATLQITGALRNARNNGQDVLATLDGYRPVISQLGVDDATFGQIRQLFASDPEAIDKIEQLVGQRQRELQFQKTGDNLLVFEQGNPDPIRRFEAPRQPIEIGGVLVDPTTYQPILDTREPRYQTVQNSDGTTSVVAIDQPAPVSSAGGGGSPSASNVDPVAIIQQIIPGVSFNSGLRTPEQNRSARGSPNSYHLSGNAVDIPPQSGLTTGQLRQQLEAQGVNVRELIDEGDHWHIAWSGGQTAPNFGRGEAPRSGGVRVVAGGQQNGPSRSEIREEQRQGRQDRLDQSALRREFNGRQEVKDYRTVQAAYDSVRAAASSPSAAGDLSLIFAYMKILDPGSVVREQEFANAQNAAGVPDQIRNLYNRALNGERLNPRQRQDFVSQANNLFRSRTETYDRIANEYRQEAELSGFDPGRIVPQAGRSQAQTNAPGLPFNINETQLAYRNRLAQNGASSTAPLGSARNPYYTNPQDERSGLSNYQRRANESGREVVVITSRGPAIIRPNRGGR